MKLGKRLDSIHFRARRYKWLSYFATFCRLSLAAGFIPSGLQKVLGERFTVLAVNHPMGHFLDAFYQTGYYYTFVGVMQVLAAILLLIPRTVTLGAFIYFPIILNITILSLSVRFDGSQITSPLMTCAVLFLLAWNYHRFRAIFPFNQPSSQIRLPSKEEMTSAFPGKFLAAVLGVILLVVFHTSLLYDILLRNTFNDCITQCENIQEQACLDFCTCIHKEGHSLEDCLMEYEANK